MIGVQVTEQEASRLPAKCGVRRLYLSLAFLCITASAVIFLLVIFCSACKQNSSADTNGSYFVITFGGFAISLLIFGGCILFACCTTKRPENSSQSVITPQVVVSLVPSEDLEKSPAYVLPCNHILDRQPFVQASIDLPNYFTVVQTIDEIDLSVEAGFWTEDIPGTPPPCYEQALKMATLPATVAREAETHYSKNGEYRGYKTMIGSFIHKHDADFV